MTDQTSENRSTSINAGTLWAGGLAAAVVAGLVTVVGVLVCRGILGIPVLAPKGKGVWGDADTATYAFGAALATLAAVLAPFATKGALNSKFATAGINLVLGGAIGTLGSASARSAVRQLPPSVGPSQPSPWPAPPADGTS